MEALWDLVPAGSTSLVVAVSRVFIFTWRHRPGWSERLRARSIKMLLALRPIPVEVQSLIRASQLLDGCKS